MNLKRTLFLSNMKCVNHYICPKEGILKTIFLVFMFCLYCTVDRVFYLPLPNFK